MRPISFRLKLALAIALLAGVLSGAAALLVARPYFGAYPPRELIRFFTTPPRADIDDRNGVVLARAEWRPSIFADNGRDRARSQDLALRLAAVFPDIDAPALAGRLASRSGFVWIKRRASEEDVAKLRAERLAGVRVRYEPARHYDEPTLLPFVLGFLNADGQGISGLERGLDSELARSSAARRISIDARIQRLLDRHLRDEIAKQNAKAGVGIVLDPQTGEILALASAPAFSLEDARRASASEMFNRATAAVYETRGVAQLHALANLFEHGYRPSDRLPLIAGYSEAGAFLPTGEQALLADLYDREAGPTLAYASMELGPSSLQTLFARLGLTTRLPLELPESGAPMVAHRRPSHQPSPPASDGADAADKAPGDASDPDRATDPDKTADPDKATNSDAAATAPDAATGSDQPSEDLARSPLPLASGEGWAASPLAVAASVAAVVNCGRYVLPTLLPRSHEQIRAASVPVYSPRTAAAIRELMRHAAQSSTAGPQALAQFDPGLTMSIDAKVLRGRYDPQYFRSAAAVAFPMRDPRFLVYVMIDEPSAGAASDEDASSEKADRNIASEAVARFVGELTMAVPDTGLPMAGRRSGPACRS